MLLKPNRPIRARIYRRILVLIGPIEVPNKNVTINLSGPIRTPVYRRVVNLIDPIGTLGGIGLYQSSLRNSNLQLVLLVFGILSR